MSTRVEQLLNERARIEAELEEALEAEDSWPRRVQMGLLSSKDSNWDLLSEGELDGMTEDAQRTFSYTLYEVLFEVEVNKDGTSKILRAVCGKEVLVPEDG